MRRSKAIDADTLIAGAKGRWRKAMNSKKESNMWHSDRQVSQRAGLHARLGWAAFCPCLVVAGCGASPAATTSGDEQVAQTKQAVAVATDVALHVLGKCLDVPGFNDTNGTNVQIYDCNGGTNQQWELWSDGTVRPTFNTNKCLDLPGWETENGTPIQIYDCHGSSNQQWTRSSTGYLKGYGGKCVDDPAFSTSNGTNLQYYDCNGGFSQVFTLAPPRGGPSTFLNLKAEEDNVEADQEMCMGIAGGVLGTGYPFDRDIIVWDCNGSPDQMWTRTFQSDPSGQSGVVDLVDSSLGLFEGESYYPVCLWNEFFGVKPYDGLQMTTEYCPDEGPYHGGFVFNYVQNDALGYPCYTLQDPQSGLYVGVANAQANPVQNGMPIIFWDYSGSDDQVWCDHSANTGFFTVTPDFVITNVIYAPPGKSSSMAYQSTTTVGSALTSTKSFQDATDVTATASVGSMMTQGMDSVSVSYDHTFGDSDTKEVDQTTTWTQGNKKPGETNGIDHDWDEIWFVVHPILNVSFTPGSSGAPDVTNWQFAQGDGETTAITGFAYAGELNGDIAMSAQNQQLFGAFGITRDMYRGLLQADAFFNGIAPTPGMDTARFDYINEFPYQPPPAPLGQGQMASTQPYAVTQSTSTSDTTTTSYSNSVGVTVTSALNLNLDAVPFKASLSVSNKWTWTHSSSNKESSGTGSMDTLTVGQPDFGYNGPGLLHVYEDRIFKTYAFTLDYAGPAPFTDDGGYQCQVGGVWMHCCPPGNAMVGILLDQNVFKCAELQDASGPIVADTSTYRDVSKPNDDGTSTIYNMHTCPLGYVMVGLREDQNVLACQQIPPNAINDAITGELVDTGTQDAYPMRACESTPRAYAMSGFDGANNLLTCATNPGLK